MIDINIWRLTTSGKVWYEWNVMPKYPLTDKYMTNNSSEIHNVNGRSYSIGLNIY